MFLKAATKKDALIHISIIMFLFLVLTLLFFYVYLPSTTNHGEIIKVPDLKGKTVDQISEILRQNGLRYQVNDSSYVEGETPSAVLSQNPVAGSEVKSNRKIYVTVASRNPPFVTMLELRQESFKAAEIKLKSIGLVMMKPTMVSGPFAGLVINQYADGKEIAPGARIPKGTKIRLDVSSGNEKDEMD